MKPKRNRPSEEQIARSERVWQQLRTRLAYHRQKLLEERAQKR
jgi:hypothetical protein